VELLYFGDLNVPPEASGASNSMPATNTKKATVMNLTFETTFVVMPAHCNYHYPMIFGGQFFSELDLCAAQCVSRLLHDSECDSAVTHKYEGTFHAAAECGDLVFMKAQVVELRNKAVKVNVKSYRERRATPGQDFIAEATFVFVTKKQGKFQPHGLTLPK
jgi:acyl-CoA hydrolase